ncbi:MAG: phosphoglucosamine mutase [Bacillota bacterium]
MGRIFGTDGVRGVVNRDLSCELAFDIGVAGAYALTDGDFEKHERILIGRDTRISCDMLEAALAAGICSLGSQAICVGVLPTPALAYLTRHLNADAGVMISASHNPVEYNGIKWVDRNGFKLPDETEDRIEELIFSGIENLPRPTGTGVGRIVRRENCVDDYIAFLLSTIDVRLDGFKIVMDCANGAAYEAAPRVFRELGAEVIVYCDQPDGTNINKDCGSTHPNHLQGWVVEHGADLGLAFDGDADRLIAVDAEGNVVNGDRVMAICALDMKRRGLLKNDTLVTTVMSNLGLEIAMRDAGICLAKTNVGDRYVLEHMLKNGCALGGEQSGHIIFLEHSTTGDGILTALQLLSAIVRSGKTLQQLASVMTVFPQVLVNARVDGSRKNDYESDPEIAVRIEYIIQKYHGRGRVLIRPSGTEPLVRVMIEGEDEEDAFNEARLLAAFIEERLG